MLRRPLVLVTVLVLVLISSAAAVAQETRGSIEGTVRDAGGNVLPGVTVEARSSASGALSATTDSSGRYRFPRVPPGRYSVRANLMGFRPAEVANVEVELGSMKTVDVTMNIEAVAETITVTADAPMVDVTQTSTSTSIAREQLELIPKGRDFTSVATMAAGATNETFLGGVSIDGASASENRYVIDGQDTTHPRDGLQGQSMITDFLEEIQVKSAGYAAEFGGSVGGVINAVTKSGTNSLDGQVGAYYSDRAWEGSERPTPYRSAPGNFRLFPEEDVTRLEPFASVGGPLLRDALWFWLGYSQTELETSRTPVGNANSFTQTDTREYLSGNLKGNIGSNFLFKLSGSQAPRTIDDQLPARDNSTPAGTTLTIDQEFEAESYSGYADFIPTPQFYLSGRLGYYKTDNRHLGDIPASGTPRIFFRNGEIPLPTSDPRYRPTGFATVPSGVHFGITQFDLWERESASFDANFFTSGLGEHSIKAGVQYENVFNDVALGEIGNLFEIRWGLPDRLGAGVQGQYGSVHVRRFGTFGAAESNNLGFYVQDSWRVVPSFTLNLGVRTERETVPNYAKNVNPDAPSNAFEFGFGDKLAPRLGFAWDVLDNQRLKAYGSWGKYYDIMKLAIARGSFGGDRWIGYIWPLNTLDWQSLPNGCTTSTNDPAVNPCPNLGPPAATLDLRHPSDPTDPASVDPDLRPMEQEEWQLGADYLLTNNIVVGARYVNKKLNAVIEDIGRLVCTSPTACQEEYFIGNPGLGQNAEDPIGPVPAQPKAVRDYEAIELTFMRRFVNNWSARLAYTYSELWGNYAGLGSSDEFGRTDPNVSRLFDHVYNSYDAQGNPVYGPLGTDRPHQLDAQVAYRFPFGTSLGLNQYYGSGTPISTQVNFAGVPFFPFGRGDQGRTEALTQTDVRVAHEFRLGPVGLEASLNVLNLFDEDAALLIDPNYSETDFCTPAIIPGCVRSETWFFTNTPLNISALPQNNPFYLRPNAVGSTLDPFQARRSVRFGLSLNF